MTLAEDETPPAWDDREVFRLPPHVADPVRQKRGFNARKRGVKTELELRRLFEDNGFKTLSQGGPNRRDFVATKGEIGWSVECKHMTDKWPLPGAVREAWTQATRQADIYRPLLVFANRRRGVKTQWRVYCPDGFKSLLDWFVDGWSA